MCLFACLCACLCVLFVCTCLFANLSVCVFDGLFVCVCLCWLLVHSFDWWFVYLRVLLVCLFACVCILIVCACVIVRVLVCLFVVVFAHLIAGWLNCV